MAHCCGNFESDSDTGKQNFSKKTENTIIMDQSHKLQLSLETAMDKLRQIWDRIGIGKSAKEERSSAVLRHLTELLDEMVREEEALEKQIEQKVESHKEEIEKLAKELGLPQFKPQTDLAILQLEKELRHKEETLKQEKRERLKILSKLHQEDQELCDAMCMTPYYIPSGTTPTGEQLEKLKEHISSLSKEKEKRYKTFVKQKKEITDLMLQMERSPDTAFEKEVVNEDEATFVLSTDNMHALDALVAELQSSKIQLEVTVEQLWNKLHVLWERLEVPESKQEKFMEGKEGFRSSVIEALQQEIKKCEAQKLANIQRFVDGLRKELDEWWDKCYYSAQQRSEFKHYNTNAYTEDLLNKHEAEVANLKSYYENHKQVLELVAKRETLFHQMIAFEKKAHDPNRFFSDRGGKLLQEEKERKALMKQLPRVEQTVTNEINKWENDHGRCFLVNGMSFLAYMKKTWKDFEEEKIREKEERHKAKTKLMNEEVIYGSKPSTPVKRRFQPNTPNTTQKFRKIDNDGGNTLRVSVNESKTPSSCTKIQHSSLYVSPYTKVPSSTSKVPQASKVMSAASKTAPGTRNRRRSNRLARKILGERKDGINESIFSQTTVSSDHAGVGGNLSVASTGSYQEFATGLNPSARPFCRSSVAPPPPSPRANRDLHRL